MRAFVDFEKIEDAEQFAETYEGNVVKVITGNNFVYRVFYYED